MILAFLASRLGQAAIVAAGIVALLVAFASHERSKGEAKAVAKMERNANANAAKAEAARRYVDKLPADGLRDKFFRD